MQKRALDMSQILRSVRDFSQKNPELVGGLAGAGLGAGVGYAFGDEDNKGRAALSGLIGGGLLGAGGGHLLGRSGYDQDTQLPDNEPRKTASGPKAMPSPGDISSPGAKALGSRVDPGQVGINHAAPDVGEEGYDIFSLLSAASRDDDPRALEDALGNTDIRADFIDNLITGAADDAGARAALRDLRGAVNDPRALLSVARAAGVDPVQALASQLDDQYNWPDLVEYQ